MNTKKILLIGLGVSLFLGTTVGVTFLSLHFFTHGQKGGVAGFHGAHEFLHQIELTSDQKKQLEPHEAILKKELDDVQIKMATKRISVCTLLNSSASDTEEVMASVDEIGALQAEQQKLVVQHLLAMRDILTPGQRDKFFGAMMTDICQKCRDKLCLTDKKCLCGRCGIDLHSKVGAHKAG